MLESAPRYTGRMATHFPLTRVLARDVPGGSRSKGRQYHLDGAVTRLEGDAWSARATVRGSHEYRVRIDRRSDAFAASCECLYFIDRDVICKHIWAVLLEAERRDLLMGSGAIGDAASLVPEPEDDSDAEFAVPRSSRGPRPSRAPWETFLTEFAQQLRLARAAVTRAALRRRAADLRHRPRRHPRHRHRRDRLDDAFAPQDRATGPSPSRRRSPSTTSRTSPTPPIETSCRSSSAPSTPTAPTPTSAGRRSA